MTDFRSTIASIGDALQQASIPYMLIGGQAVLVHGQPRLTEDIDITLGIGPAEYERLLVLATKLDLTPLVDDPSSFVRTTHVLPTRSVTTGIRVDFIFSSTQYEAGAIARAIPIELNARTVHFATAEDLIIHKLLAARERDIEDIRGIVSRKGDAVDWEYVERWTQAFLDIPEHEDIASILAEIRS